MLLFWIVKVERLRQLDSERSGKGRRDRRMVSLAGLPLFTLHPTLAAVVTPHYQLSVSVPGALEPVRLALVLPLPSEAVHGCSNQPLPCRSCCHRRSSKGEEDAFAVPHL